MHVSRVALISFLAFLLGLMAGLAFALHKHKQDEGLIISLIESHQVDIPHDVWFRLRTISAAETGDFSWIIRSNCAGVRSKTPFIDPSLFKGPRKTEVIALIERARNKVHALEQGNLCSISH
jgi:hypothetical protein